MKQSNFVAECVKRCIDPAIALENDNIRAALRVRDDEKVKEILDKEF